MSKQQRSGRTPVPHSGQGSEPSGLRWAMGIGLLSFLVYFITLQPSVGGGDSGLLTIAAANLSVAHPPGYPLYTLLAHLFTLIPVESVAWRVNLSSAFFGALAVAVFFSAILKWTASLPAAFFTAGFFAFSPMYWEYATVAEVFTLHILFLAILIYLAVRFDQDHQEKWVYAGAFCFGLALCNHHTVLFLGLPLLGWVLLQDQEKRLLNLKSILILGALTLLGMLPYLYLPWASGTADINSWGETHSWIGFFTHFFRREFGTFRLASNEVGNQNYFFEHLIRDLTAQFSSLLWAGGVLVILGVYSVIKRPEPKKHGLTKVLLFSAAFYLIVFEGLSNVPPRSQLYFTHTRFWLQPQIYFCFFLAPGFIAIMQRYRWSTNTAWAAAVLSIALQIFCQYPKIIRHKNFTLRDFGKAVLEPLPPGALLLALGDSITVPLFYVHELEHVRPDLKLLDQNRMTYTWASPLIKRRYPEIDLPGPFYDPAQQSEQSGRGYTMKTFLDVNINHFPIYVIDGFRPEEARNGIETAYVTVPAGFASVVIPKNKVTDPLLKEFAGLAQVNLAQVNLTKLNIEALITQESPSWEGLILEVWKGASSGLDHLKDYLKNQ